MLASMGISNADMAELSSSEYVTALFCNTERGLSAEQPHTVSTPASMTAAVIFRAIFNTYPPLPCYNANFHIYIIAQQGRLVKYFFCCRIFFRISRP